MTRAFLASIRDRSCRDMIARTRALRPPAPSRGLAPDRLARMSTPLTGAAGEYYVAAECRGRDGPRASRPRARTGPMCLLSTSRPARCAIQVKTCRAAQDFRLSVKDEAAARSPGEWFVFVRLDEQDEKPPRYFVVPRNLVSALIHLGPPALARRSSQEREARQQQFAA
jgi:hypothetical protein